VANKTVPQELRFIAVITLKNAVSKNWKSKEYASSHNSQHTTTHTPHHHTTG
jgi:hypothetical protein